MGGRCRAPYRHAVPPGGRRHPLDGLGITWTDTNGVTNAKWSYWAPELWVFHEAHVEAVETGTHVISVADQPGCDVQSISVGGRTSAGPGSVAVKIASLAQPKTVFVDVVCA